MREFREIDDIEEKLRVSERKRMTFEEAREYVKKFDKSLEESKVERDEVSSETEFERTKREIREYIDAVEKSEELIDEIISSIFENPLKTDDLDIGHTEIPGRSRDRRIQTPQCIENRFKEYNESLEESKLEKEMENETDLDSEKAIVQIFVKVDSKEKFDRAQSNFPHLMMGMNYEKKSRAIYDYFERTENGENVSKPPLLKRFEKLELRRIYATVSGELPDVPLKSMTDLDRLLQKFPEYKTKPKFPEHYRRARIYFAVRNDWSKMEKELATEYGVSESTIGNYRRGEKEPRLVSKLRSSEEERIIQKWAKTRQLDETTIERLKRISPTKIEQVIENRIQDTQPNQLTQIEEIEKQIATSLELSSKVVVADIHSLKSNRVSDSYRKPVQS